MNPTPIPSRSERELSVLLIDDDVELGELMREFFNPRGIRITAVPDGQRGLAEAFDRQYDLMLQRDMRLRMCGLGLSRQVRRRSLVPVIILTARTARADRI